MTESYCIALQPICDHKMRHIADELLYRSSPTAYKAEFNDAVLATARASHIAFYEIGIERLVGKRLIFMNAPHQWLLSPDLLPPFSSQIVIEVLEDVVVDPVILKALSSIKRKGYKIALDDFVLSEKNSSLLQYADYVKIDAWETISDDELAYYKNKNIKLIAEKVETQSDFELLVKKGFDYFQGYFYSKPAVKPESVHDRLSNRQALMRLLAELQYEYVDYDKLIDLILLDPQLTYIILKHTNSAFYGLTSHVNSIHTAIHVLGLRRLRALVASQLFVATQGSVELLLPLVLTRAAMYESLALMNGLNGHLAFIVGVLSKMHLIFGDSYQELLAQLALSQAEILQLETREGRCGRLLGMIEAFEEGEVAKLTAEEVNLLNEVWLESRVWVEDVLCHIQDEGLSE